ncbi:MAG: leucyl aminopeptidase family protein [Proteobacteria bacterium]|nr:leucyl aminopeptidase family protein [Pseudomonadota bacterium]
MPPKFTGKTQKAIPIDFISSDGLKQWLAAKPEALKTWVKASGFSAGLGQVLTVPDADGNIKRVLAGWGDADARGRGRYWAASIAMKLPKGVYEFSTGLKAAEQEEASLAWLLAQYAFDRYKVKSGAKARLKPGKNIDVKRLETLAAGEFLTRDLINIPASDMGPNALEAAFQKLAKTHKAKVSVISGAALLKKNFPMIHAVGRASDQAPRLLDMTWGLASHPKVTLVGKGVCFDTGGLNIKPGPSMGLMKKDMGGSATVMGLAHMIMALKLKVRLRVLVPAVENVISANAFRPQDVLTSRKGLTVEVNNTDAEGRLVLADALAYGDEAKPDLMVCMATLTGAARVALGADIPPFFTDSDKLATVIAKAAVQEADPLWRLPFWDPYEPEIEPDVADLDNAPKGGFGGAITAALFLRRFVQDAGDFVHLDLYGWTPSAKPGRSKGGACQSARAMLRVIEREYCNE